MPKTTRKLPVPYRSHTLGSDPAMLERRNRIGASVAEMREEHDMSRTTLAQRVGVSMNTIHNIESGRNWAALPVYLKICQVLKVQRPPMT